MEMSFECCVPWEFKNASSVHHLGFRVSNYVLGHLAIRAEC